MSGLSHTPGKRARGKTLRGFESRLLRQRPLARGFFRLNPLVPLPAVLLRMVNDYGEEINPGSPAAFCPAQLLL